MNTIYLLLGSNLGDRFYNLERCIALLQTETGGIINKSSIYETEPWGTEIPLAYLNMMVVVENDKTPEQTLESILLVEQELGRERGPERNMPRTVDIDIIFYNNEVIKKDNLIIPHERMHLRKFVLVPLVEIAPGFVHPVFHKTSSELLATCIDKSWIKKYNF